jgi:hypothetical protein
MKTIPLLSDARCGTMCFIWYLKSISNNSESSMFYDVDYNFSNEVGKYGKNNILVGSELLNNKEFFHGLVKEFYIKNDLSFDNDVYENKNKERPDKYMEHLIKAINSLPDDKIPEYFIWSFHAGHLGLKHKYYEEVFKNFDCAILLERKNKLANWVSVRKSHHFEEFANYDYTDYKIEFSVEGKRNLENYEKFEEIKSRVWGTYRRLLKKYNIPNVEIFYEDWEYLNPPDQLNYIVDKVNQLPGVNLKVDKSVEIKHPFPKQNNYKNIEDNFTNPEVYLEYVKNKT